LDNLLISKLIEKAEEYGFKWEWDEELNDYVLVDL